MTMRFGVLIIWVILVSAIFVAGGSKKEELFGTWINDEYKGSTAPHGINVYNPDGTYEVGRKEPASWEKDVEISEGGWHMWVYGTYTIADKWTTADGNVWYKVQYNFYDLDKVYTLMKISDSNNTLEIIVSGIDYPEEIDHDADPYHYRIYYRQ